MADLWVSTDRVGFNPPERPGRLDDRVGIDAAALSFYPSLLGNPKQFGQLQGRLHLDFLHPLLSQSRRRPDKLQGAPENARGARIIAEDRTTRSIVLGGRSSRRRPAR